MLLRRLQLRKNMRKKHGFIEYEYILYLSKF